MGEKSQQELDEQGMNLLTDAFYFSKALGGEPNIHLDGILYGRKFSLDIQLKTEKLTEKELIEHYSKEELNAMYGKEE